MSEALKKKVASAKASLTAVSQSLAAPARKLPTALVAELAILSGAIQELDVILKLIEVRAAGREIIRLLPTRVAASNVEFLGIQMPFAHARDLAVQGYLSSVWSICDRITAISGRMLCIESVAKDSRGAKLLEHFIKPAVIAGTLSSSTKKCFGWPVGLSYALRNLFLHDGGKPNGRSEFFVPGSLKYEITDTGWKFIENKLVHDYGVQSTDTLVEGEWPCDDLEGLIEVCHRELDDVCGMILLSACSSFSTQTLILLQAI